MWKDWAQDSQIMECRKKKRDKANGLEQANMVMEEVVLYTGETEVKSCDPQLDTHKNHNGHMSEL